MRWPALLLMMIAGPSLTAGAPTPPPQPFRIAGNLYSVGAGDETAFLIFGSEGMILLDAGPPGSAEAVLANIRKLGFDPRQIRLLLNSQAHQDHAGALAAIKAATGARMLASRADAVQLEDGGRGDFAFGDRLVFAPVAVDRIVDDGEIVTLGDIAITAHLTPGHTKGCTSWTMPVRDGQRTLNALFICGPTVPGYRLTGNQAYPEIIRDYEASFATWRRLPCQLFLGAHGSYFGMERKRAAMKRGRPNPFVDPRGVPQVSEGVRATLPRADQAGASGELSKALTRHCEERSEAAIQRASESILDCFAALAMTAKCVLRRTRHQAAVQPPSIDRLAPVIEAASSRHKKRTKAAI